MQKSTLIIDGDNRGAQAAINKTVTGMQKAEGDISRIGSGISGTLGGVSSLLTNIPFLISGAATGAVVGFAHMIKSSIDYADSLNEMSQRVGVSVENLSTLKYVAELNGLTFETLEKGLVRLSKNMFEVSSGSGKAAKDGFDALGISVKDATGNLKDGSVILKEMADKFAGMEDGSKKTAIAVTLLGRSGADLIPTLNLGSRGISNLQDEAKKLGLEISTNTALQADYLKDNMKRLEGALEGVANSAARDLLPALNDIADVMVNVSSSGEHSLPVFTAIGVALKYMSTMLLEVIANINIAAQIFDALFNKPKEQWWNNLKKIGEGYSDAFDSAVKMWEGQAENNIQEEAALKTRQQLWGGIMDYWNQSTELSDKEKKALEDHQKQWESLNKTLSLDIAKATLPEISAKIYEIDQRFRDYAAQFPGHIKQLKEWHDAVVNTAADMENVKPKGVDAVSFRPVSIPPVIPDNMDAIKNQYKDLADWQIAEVTRVTAMEALNYGLRTDTAIEMYDNLGKAAYNFGTVQGRQSKIAFDIYKAYAAAQAGIATYEMATKAYNAMVGIPFVGPILAVAAAAAAITYGLSNINNILAMQPGGGGGIPPSPTYTPTSNISNNSTTTNNNARHLTVNIYGYIGDLDELGRRIIPAIERAYSDGAGGR